MPVGAADDDIEVEDTTVPWIGTLVRPLPEMIGACGFALGGAEVFCVDTVSAIAMVSFKDPVVT